MRYQKKKVKDAANTMAAMSGAGFSAGGRAVPLAGNPALAMSMMANPGSVVYPLEKKYGRGGAYRVGGISVGSMARQDLKTVLHDAMKMNAGARAFHIRKWLLFVKPDGSHRDKTDRSSPTNCTPRSVLAVVRAAMQVADFCIEQVSLTDWTGLSMYFANDGFREQVMNNCSEARARLGVYEQECLLAMQTDPDMMAWTIPDSDPRSGAYRRWFYQCLYPLLFGNFSMVIDYPPIPKAFSDQGLVGKEKSYMDLASVFIEAAQGPLLDNELDFTDFLTGELWEATKDLPETLTDATVATLETVGDSTAAIVDALGDAAGKTATAGRGLVWEIMKPLIPFALVGIAGVAILIKFIGPGNILSLHPAGRAAGAAGKAASKVKKANLTKVAGNALTVAGFVPEIRKVKISGGRYSRAARDRRALARQ
jgi:hypothetical protein